MLRLFRRQRSTPIDPAAAAFLERVVSLAPHDWEVVLRTTADRWGGGRLDPQMIFDAMAADPAIEPFKPLLAKPDAALSKVLDAAGAARQASDVGEALALMFPDLDPLEEFDRLTSLVWLPDTLVKTAAVAIACKDRLPAASVAAAVMPFTTAMPDLSADGVLSMRAETATSTGVPFGSSDHTEPYVQAGNDHDDGSSHSDDFSPRLDSFIADIGSGFHSNWLTVLRRTVGGQGVEPGRYAAALARIEEMARRSEHSASVARAERRALERARPKIVGAMSEISRTSPGASVTQQARIDTCEHFTKWAVTALALQGHIRSDDLEIALDPFKDVIGIAGR